MDWPVCAWHFDSLGDLESWWRKLFSRLLHCARSVPPSDHSTHCMFVFYFIYFGCLRQSGLKFTMCLRLALNSWPSHFHAPGSGSTSMYYHILSWGSSALPALGSWGAGSAAWAILPSFRSLCFKLGIFILKASYVLAVYLLVCRNSPCLLLSLFYFPAGNFGSLQLFSNSMGF